jgi:hypothetical protein
LTAKKESKRGGRNKNKNKKEQGLEKKPPKGQKEE